MDWFWIALTGPALWAPSNHIDKHLVERYFRGRGVGTLVIPSALVGAVVAPVIFFFRPEVVIVGGSQGFLMAANGAVFMLGIILYLYAMEAGEASVVAPLFQLIPVFVLALGYIFLGEVLTAQQLAGGLLIVAGSIAISLSMEEGTARFNKKVLILMSLSSLIMAANFTFFKKFALEDSFWTTFFWGYTGVLAVGIVSFVLVTPYRRTFIHTIRTQGAKILSLSVLNETIDVGANLGIRYAAMLAPLALVQVVNGFQPAFVFLYGILLTLLFPSFGRESLAKRHIFQKALSIAVMVAGAVIIAG